MAAAGSVKDGFHHIDGAELLRGCLKRKNKVKTTNTRTPKMIHMLILGLASMVSYAAGDEAM